MSFWCQKFSFDVQNIFGLSVILFSKVAITEANNRLAHEVKKLFVSSNWKKKRGMHSPHTF